MRLYGFAAAYVFVLVTGTAVLMAAFATHRGASEILPDSSRMTARPVMQHSAGFGVHATDGLLATSTKFPNDQRGF